METNTNLIPLISDITSGNIQHMTEVLAKLTSDERHALINLDIWEKDDITPELFSSWIVCYANAPRFLQTEFVTSREFALYIKGVFNISTLDLEEPIYPDHDNFFVTDDNAFLFEFAPDYAFESEIKELLKVLYDEKGVAFTYNYLISIIGVSFYDYQEKLYNHKKEVLSEYGIPDYYDAITTLAPFKDEKDLQSFVKNRQVMPFEISETLKSQTTLPGVINLDLFENIAATSDARQDYLKFSLNKLYNNYIIYKKLYKSNTLAVLDQTKHIEKLIKLGISYLGENPFDRFDFIDFYKIGNTFITLAKKKILRINNLAFLGNTISNFLDLTNLKPTLISGEELLLDNYTNLTKWNNDFNELLQSLAVINELQSTLNVITTNQLVNDFYLNYKLENIDLEAVLITMFANQVLGHSLNKKLGLTISECKQFYNSIKLANELIASFASIHLETAFLKKLFFTLITSFISIDYNELRDQDFKHIDGIIILNS